MKTSNERLRIVEAKDQGFSLVELMVAITIGMLLLIGLVAIFVNSNQSYLELQKSAQQIEAGRYAVQVVSDDLRQAGYFGDFSVLPDVSKLGSTLPDPCDKSSALTTFPYSYLALPIQGYNSPTSTPISSCLSSNDFVAGTDVLVIRRAGTEILSATNLPVENELYIQARMDVAEVSLGGNDPTKFFAPQLAVSGNTVSNVGTNAGGGTPTVLKKLNDPTAAPTISAFRVAADIRKLHVHIYFVAPCSRPKTGLSCAGDGTDDNGTPIPTLKRLELKSTGGVLSWNIVPLVEGIENFQVEYGVDTTDPITGTSADGMPDGVYVKSLTSPADFARVVAARIFILARNTTLTQGYSSSPNKAYCLASLVNGACPSGSSVTFSGTSTADYKRHLFTSEVRLLNPGGRREIP